MPVVRRSTWYGHSEAVLQAMICSSSEDERRLGVEAILAIRGDDQIGNNSVRVRRTPMINVGAECLSELTELTPAEASEPRLTCTLTSDQIKEFILKPMVVPDWSSHTQSVERCVKLVTEAAANVYSHEKRDGVIRAQVVSRKIMSSNKSKKDLVNLAQFRKPGV